MIRKALFRWAPKLRDWIDSDGPDWVWSLVYKIDNAIWWVAHRIIPRYRFHMVPTGLKPEYHDVDSRMEGALFELLKFHVEEERGGKDALAEEIRDLREEYTDKTAFGYDRVMEQIAHMQRILDVYIWVTETLPRLREEYDRVEEEWHSRYTTTSRNDPEQRARLQATLDMEVFIHDEISRKLVEIVEIRNSMWT